MVGCAFEGEKPKIQLSFDEKGALTNLKVRCKAKDFRKAENMVREYLEIE